MTLGLVIEGGGAKGAFSFGCLLALKEAGIRFDAVAGTSVGALNGAIVATESWEEGERLWSTITRENVYPLRRPAWVFSALMPFIVAVQLLVLYGLGIPLPVKSKFTRTAMRLGWALFFTWPSLLFLLSAAIYLVVEGMGGDVMGVLVGVFCGFLAAFVFTEAATRRDRAVDVKESVELFYLLGFLGVFGIFWELGAASVVGWVCLAVYCAAAAFLLLVRRWGACWLRAMTVLNNEPLMSSIAMITGRPFLTPMYVTLACGQSTFDPDKPTYRYDPSAAMVYIARARITKYREWYPTYFSVHEVAPELRLLALLGSAALPFGIVPSVRIKSESFVDGGVVDNCPIYPLISSFRCDEIVVLSLSPECTEETLKAQWKEVDRRMRLAELQDQYNEGCIYSERYHFDHSGESPKPDPEALPLREPENWPVVRIIRPESSLGGLFSGTLNFSAEYSRKLIELGREIANAKLCEWYGDSRKQQRAPDDVGK